MRYITFLGLLSLSLTLSAQWSSDFWYAGFQVGANYSPIGITNIPEMIIPPHHPEHTYNVKSYKPVGFTAGGFLHKQINVNDLPVLGVSFNLDWSQQNAGYDYDDIKNLKYSMESLGVSPKVYPFVIIVDSDEWYSGIYFRPGLQVGLNIANQRIFYCHSPDTIYGPCPPVQRELRRYFEGTPYMGFTVGGGWEFNLQNGWGIGVNLQKYASLQDIIITYENSYGFTDPKNLIESFSFSVSIVKGLERRR